jgi:hypothetical protein
VKRPETLSDARNESVARFHARQKKYSSREHGDFRDLRITTAFAEKGDSRNYIRSSGDATEHRRSGRSLAETRKRENFRSEARRNMELERLQSKSAASYADWGSPVIPQRDTTAVSTVASSGLDRIRGNDLRAKILARRDYNSKMTIARRDYDSKPTLARRPTTPERS